MVNIEFFVVSLRLLRDLRPAPTPEQLPLVLLLFFGALAHGLVVAWALAAFAFRRAADADVSGVLAAAAILPFFQIPVIAALAFLPPRTTPPHHTVAGELNAAAAAQGLTRP